MKTRYSIYITLPNPRSQFKAYKLSVIRQNSRKKGDTNKRYILQFIAWLTLENGMPRIANVTGNGKNKVHKIVQKTELWNRDNYKDIAINLMKYWIATKNSSTQTWTDFWFCDIKKDITYKLYDCSLYFLTLCNEQWKEKTNKL